MMLERGDFFCIHEPLCSLRDLGSVELDDGRGRSARLTSLDAVIDHLLTLSSHRPVFVKETTDHDYEEGFGSPLFAENVKTTFMIREPQATISSHLRKSSNASINDVGFRSLTKIGEHLNDRGTGFHIIDSDDLVCDPAGTVRQFCTYSDIPYIESSLTWSPGHRKEWDRARHWHDEVAETGGFNSEPIEYPAFDSALEAKKDLLCKGVFNDYKKLVSWQKGQEH